MVSLKFYRPLYMMGARLSWPVKKLRGGQHKCEYICEYSTNFKCCGIVGLLLNIPIRICITICVLVLSLQLKFENKNSKSNILTVFRIEACIRCCIKIAMLHLVCMSISRLFNDCITNPQQLRNLSRTSFSDGTQ